jgi:hypothetical protein
MGKLLRALSADWRQEPCSVLPLHNRAITPLHLSMSFRHPVATGLGGNLFGTTTGAYGDGPEFAFATRLSSSPNGFCASYVGGAQLSRSGFGASPSYLAGRADSCPAGQGRRADLRCVSRRGIGPQLSEAGFMQLQSRGTGHT